MKRTAVRRVAITGGVGCGKSAVAENLRSAGVPVLDADDVARELLSSGHPVARRVLRAFGSVIRTTEGDVNRAALAGLVFRNPAALNQLNRLMHPTILRRCRGWMAEQPGPVAAVVVPLLHELGLDREWPEVWCVVARRDHVMKRLALRGWSRAEALRRIRSQLPVRVKAARSTRVIENNGTKRDLTRAVREALGPPY
jgi:dephospho-CoA kinase